MSSCHHTIIMPSYHHTIIPSSHHAIVCIVARAVPGKRTVPDMPCHPYGTPPRSLSPRPQPRGCSGTSTAISCPNPPPHSCPGRSGTSTTTSSSVPRRGRPICPATPSQSSRWCPRCTCVWLFGCFQSDAVPDSTADIHLRVHGFLCAVIVCCDCVLRRCTLTVCCDCVL